MCWKISASVDVGLSGGSRVHSPGARTPIGASVNFITVMFAGFLSLFLCMNVSLQKISWCFPNLYPIEMGSVSFIES